MNKGHDKGHDKGHKGQMSDREVMKLAANVLANALSIDFNDKRDWYSYKHDAEYAASLLRQALEQPQTPDDLLRQSEREGWRYAKECEAEVKRLRQALSQSDDAAWAKHLKEPVSEKRVHESDTMERECNPHPDAPHGFNRDASHGLGRYVCDCEGWEPEPWDTTDMGIDRGAWDDVPDATKWVDELRGGDETEQEPVADSKAHMLADWLQANYEADEIDEAAEELRRLFRENQLLWKEREEPHQQLEFYIRECNRLESERDAALTKQQEPVAGFELLREARDNCKASIVEEGISASRKEYRIDLEARLTAALNTSPPESKPWVGLTDEDILRTKSQFKGTLDVQFDKFARAIEAKLREKNGF